MNETDIFIPVVDKIYGTATSGILFAGILGNSFSLYYFLTATSRNNNSEFFRRLYSVVSLVDLLISINSVPIAEAAFRMDRNGVMFANTVFCGAWSILWSLLWIMSVFLVGMLSVARLIILKYPYLRLKPVLAWIVPAVLAVGWLSMLVIFEVTGFILFSNYRRDLLACVVLPIESITNVTSMITRKNFLSMVTIALVRIILPSSVFIIALASLILMLCIINSNCTSRSSHINRRRRIHHEAAKTVALITFVYLMCNVFSICFSTKVFLRGFAFGLQNIPQKGIQIGLFIKQATSLNRKVIAYVILVVNFCTVSINSMVNPIVYVVRMADFRAFVWVCKSKVTRTFSRMRLMMKTTPAGTRPEEVQPDTLNNLGEEDDRPWSFNWIPSIGNGDARASRLSSIKGEPISIDKESRIVRSSSMKGRHFVSPKDSKVVRSWPTRKKQVNTTRTKTLFDIVITELESVTL